MSENNTNPAIYQFKSIRISMLQGPYAGKKPVEIADLVSGFTYYEDISKPFISANLNINDSGKNLVGSGSGPITGSELVEIDLEGPDGNDYSYAFKVYRVGDRINSGKIQNYNLGLISAEALDDPQTRIKKTLSGRPDEIVRQVLNEEGLNTAKQYIADPCDNYKTIIPKNLTPFAICAKLQDQSIPYGAGGKGDGEGAETVDGKYSEGTAGFFFYENAKGYNFRSIDSLMDIKGSLGLTNAGQESNIKTFQDSAGVETDATLIDVQFTSEINLMQGLRTGAYALRCQYYNFSTGDFSESTYSAGKCWNQLAHLGSQDGLTPGQESLAKRPTRIVSAILDDESYYSGQDAAADDLAFKDRTPETLPQAISRNYLLNTQGLRVVVPGNLQLVVGDVINVQLQNMSTEKDREVASVDEDHSGFYLITSLSRFYSKIEKRVTTMLSLKRDSYGILET